MIENIKLSDAQWDEACRALKRGMDMLFRDEKIKKEFEIFKKEYRKEQEHERV